MVSLFPPHPGLLSHRSYNTDVDRRVRGTAGGDRLESSVPPSVLVASLPCVNILFNSVVSSDAFFGSIDLTDFYLESPLAQPQFIKIYINIFSSEVLPRLSPLLPFIKHDEAGKKYIIYRIDTHPGGYYGVLRSTRVVPVIFRRQISNVAGVKYKS